MSKGIRSKRINQNFFTIIKKTHIEVIEIISWVCQGTAIPIRGLSFTIHIKEKYAKTKHSSMNQFGQDFGVLDCLTNVEVSMSPFLILPSFSLILI
jgi:hypothetical protein